MSKLNKGISSEDIKVIEALPKNLRTQALRIMRHGARRRHSGDQKILQAIFDAKERLFLRSVGYIEVEKPTPPPPKDDDNTKRLTKKQRKAARKAGNKGTEQEEDLLGYYGGRYSRNYEEAPKTLEGRLDVLRAGTVITTERVLAKLTIMGLSKTVDVESLGLEEALSMYHKANNPAVASITVRTVIKDGVKIVTKYTKLENGDVDIKELSRDTKLPPNTEDEYTEVHMPIQEGSSKAVMERIAEGVLTGALGDNKSIPPYSYSNNYWNRDTEWNKGTTNTTSTPTTPPPPPEPKPGEVAAKGKQRKTSTGKCPEVPKDTTVVFWRPTEKHNYVAARSATLLQNWLDRKYRRPTEKILYVAGEGWKNNRIPESIRPRTILDRYELGIVK